MLESFTWFKQSAYRWQGGGLTLYIDPWEVTTEDPADLIVLTHAHFDHYSKPDLERLKWAWVRTIRSAGSSVVTSHGSMYRVSPPPCQR